MIQVSENIIVLQPGEPIPPGTEEYLKIYLAGSEELGDGGTSDWQGKFIQGLESLTNSETGMLMFKTSKFLIINPKSTVQNPTISLENPEFKNKFVWKMQMMDIADAIFCNFLSKSTAMMPMFEFGRGCNTGKMVVRCSGNYVHYPIVHTMCEMYKIPLLPGKVASVLSIVQCMYTFIPRFQEIQKYQLPE